MLRLFRLSIAAIAVAGCFQLDLTTSTEAGRTLQLRDLPRARIRPARLGLQLLRRSELQHRRSPDVHGSGPRTANVGHTYYTYQPFMPHEMLYKHKRTYHRYYDEGRGLTRTHIRYW